MNAELVTKIKSRGSWLVRIRPTSYRKNRVESLGRLVNAVNSCSVNLRGWDFPHIGRESAPLRFAGYVEQYTDWEHYVEMWRAYKSGQFISITALWGDWRDKSTIWPTDAGWQSGDSVGAEDVVSRLVEVFEFAAKWSRAITIGPEIHISCVLRGLRGRALQFSPRRLLRSALTCSEEEWIYSHSYSVPLLFSSPREHAIEPALRLFELFGWDASPEVIRDMQDELRK